MKTKNTWGDMGSTWGIPPFFDGEMKNELPILIIIIQVLHGEYGETKNATPHVTPHVTPHLEFLENQLLMKIWGVFYILLYNYIYIYILKKKGYYTP